MSSMDPDVVLTVTLRDPPAPGQGHVVELYQREARSGAALADMLRTIADGFEYGDVERLE